MRTDLRVGHSETLLAAFEDQLCEISSLQCPEDLLKIQDVADKGFDPYEASGGDSPAISRLP